MHSFLLHLNSDPKQDHRIVRRSLEVTKSSLPFPEEQLRAECHALPSLGGGWFYIRPATGGHRSLIDFHATEKGVALVFGELYDEKKGDARQIYEMWRQRGIEAVRGLEGNFGAVLVDYASKQAFAVSDLMGRRALRYFTMGEDLFIATHDIPLVATGRLEPTFDEISVASIASIGWSLGGRSLLQSVRVCDSNGYVHWRDGQLDKVYQPLLPVKNRTNSRGSSKNEVVEEIAEQVCANTRSICWNSEVEVYLTAGLDSRAVLAAFLQQTSSRSVVGITDGEAGLADVDAAAYLCERYGLQHECSLPEPPDYAEFSRHLQVLAYAMNGDTSSTRAIDPTPDWSDDPPVRLYGTGGEIFRGYYYPRDVGVRQFVDWAPDQVKAYLTKKKLKKNQPPWRESEIQAEVEQRLHDAVERLSQISSLGADLLDLFYVFERYRYWGAMGARFTWQNQYSPFDSPTAVRLAFQLPPPISNGSIVHKTIIWKHLPDCYFFPINNRELLPLTGEGYLKTLSAKVVGRLLRTLEKVSKKDQSGKSKGAVRARAFSRYLRAGLDELLLEEDSLACQVFTRNVIENAISTQTSGKSPQVSISKIATVEQFRRLVTKAHEQSLRGERSI